MKESLEGERSRWIKRGRFQNLEVKKHFDTDWGNLLKDQRNDLENGEKNF